MNDSTFDHLLLQILLAPRDRGIVAIVDPIDADLVEMKWSLLAARATMYAQRTTTVNGKSKTFYLHRIILSRMLGRDLIRSEIVDHINGDSLDNRRSNLRLATSSQNSCNRGKQYNNKAGYKGVSRAPSISIRWCAAIRVNGKRHHLGTFDTPQDAARAYNNAAIEYHGKFAVLNEITE